jgi:murein DD-endopeptidase MepM/ murein hydrolase activator NlpD
LSSLISNGLKSACLAFVAVALGAGAPAMASEATDTSAPVEVSVPAVRTIAFAAPIQGYAVNSRFGLRRLSYERRARMHEGLDYAAPSGTPILAAADGRVLRTGTSSSYGRFVEIQHANGVTSFYAHMSRIGASEGDVVVAGDAIGLVGSTGRSTGAHLHFEIRRNGQQINPENFLGQSFALQDVVPEADGSWDAPAFFASAPVAFGPFRTLTPAFQP